MPDTATLSSLDRDAETYPISIGTPARLYWACCVSKIGPTCQHRTGLDPVPPSDRLDVALRTKTTAQLLAAHAAIDAMPDAAKGPEHRLTAARTSTVIEKRHDLDDAMLHIFSDDDYAGTYHEALLLALATRTA